MGARRRNKLLLVEHDLTRRLRLATAILRQGWHLTTTARGADALEVAHRIRPSVVLCDLDDTPNIRHVEELRVTTCASSTIIGLVSQGRDTAPPAIVDGVVTRPVKPATLFELIDGLEKRFAES